VFLLFAQRLLSTIGQRQFVYFVSFANVLHGWYEVLFHPFLIGCIVENGGIVDFARLAGRFIIFWPKARTAAAAASARTASQTPATAAANEQQKYEQSQWNQQQQEKPVGRIGWIA
jgi:hypothetical protein